MPRSAVKVTKAPHVYLEELQQRAVDLEKQLAASAKDTDRANQLRIPLCQVLSDMLLTDPAYTMDKDVIGRLWRHCFYSRIGPQRARIAKDKRKQLDTAKQEKSLMFFLAEAVTLYDYLADKLQCKLTGIPSSQDSASQDTSTIATLESTTSTKGIVACLHRIYIHLGDLYRYSHNLHKAERAYETAAKLGPGHGHPYNQLAVVCQVKDQQGAPLSAVALYWYARSLLATTEIFETSKANLTRLFASNRDWLGNQVDLQMDSKSPKAVQSRRFLAQFVDLHYHFFKGLVADDTWIYESISKNMDTFRQLLNNSALGDSLLCKMVTIHAFSEGFTGREILGNESSLDRTTVLQTTMLAARVATYRLGTHLAERILQSLGKLSGKLPPSVRLLLPLLLVAEYCSSRPVTSHGMSIEHSEPYEQAFADFWKKIVEVWNHLHRLLDGTPEEGVDLNALKEYQNLRGYAPFEPFLQEMEAGYLADEEAIALLQAETASTQPSQESSAVSFQSSASTLASPDQGRIKVARFLKLGERSAEDDESDLGKSIRLVDNSLEWVEEEPMMEDEPAAPMDDDTPNKKDLLVYQQAAAGGPALLVPGALLNNAEDATTTTSNRDVETENAGDKISAEAQWSPVHAPVAPLQTMPDNAIAPTLPVEPAKPPVAPPPGFAAPMAAPPASMPTVFPPATLPPPGFQQQNVPTLGDSLHLFYPPGGLKTSNPFADTNITYPPPGNASNLFGGFPSSQRDDGFLDNDDMDMDAPSLLDSSLLDTLMGKPKTKNPFLT